MKTEFAKKSFSEMPPWAKGAIGVGLLAGVGYLVYRVMRAPKDIKAGQGNRQEDRAVNQELDKVNSNPSTAQKLAKSDALAIANNVFAAMDGWGTDGLGIYKQLTRLQNQADWLAVRAAYGVREVSSGKWNPEPNYKGPLEGAMTSELGVNDIAWIQKINAYFKSKGISAKL